MSEQGFDQKKFDEITAGLNLPKFPSSDQFESVVDSIKDKVLNPPRRPDLYLLNTENREAAQQELNNLITARLQANSESGLLLDDLVDELMMRFGYTADTIYDTLEDLENDNVIYTDPQHHVHLTLP